MRTLKLKEKDSDQILRTERWKGDKTTLFGIGESENLRCLHLTDEQLFKLHNWIIENLFGERE